MSPRFDPVAAVALMRDRGLDPQEPYRAAVTPWRCLCVECGAIVYPRYNTVQQGRGGCKKCGHRSTGLKRRFDPDEAAELMRSRGLEPQEPYPGSRERWRCVCKVCGYEFRSTFDSVRQGHGCFACAGRLRGEAQSAAAAGAAVATMLAANLQPLDPYGKALAPWRCRCLTCGREVTPSLVNVRRGQGGCMWCAPKGMDFSAPGFVYLVTHPKLGAHKVGIRSAGADRLEEHARRGWRLHKERYFEITYHALRVEQAILRWWRAELRLPAHLTAEEMPQWGHTETVSADAVSLPDVWSKVLELAAQLEATPAELVADVWPLQLELFAA